MKRKLTLQLMIDELENHKKYLEWQFNQQTEFEKQTWYKAKLSLVDGLLKKLPKHYD